MMHINLNNNKKNAINNENSKHYHTQIRAQH